MMSLPPHLVRARRGGDYTSPDEGKDIIWSFLGYFGAGTIVVAVLFLMTLWTQYP